MIAEIKKSRLVFKSTGNDKIVCELVSPLDNLNEKSFVGNSMTVVGKIRGRGMMGNVTLDSCRLADAITKETVTAETAHEEPERPASPAEEITAPIPEPATAPEPPPLPPASPAAAPIATVGSAKRSAPTELAKAVIADEVAPPKDPMALNDPERAAPPSGIISEASTPTTGRFTGILPLLAAGVVGIGIGVLLTYVKFRPARGVDFRQSSSSPAPDEVRRAALEALLMGKKKHRSG